LPDARHQAISSNGGQCGRRPLSTTMFSTSTRCCIPARSSIIQGTLWRTPRCRLRRNAPSWRPGHRRIGDRFLSLIAGTCQPQGTGYHRRASRGPVRTRRRTSPSAGRQAKSPAFNVESHGGLVRIRANSRQDRLSHPGSKALRRCDLWPGTNHVLKATLV
jgi:hypothetical protein